MEVQLGSAQEHPAGLLPSKKDNSIHGAAQSDESNASCGPNQDDSANLRSEPQHMATSHQTLSMRPSAAFSDQMAFGAGSSLPQIEVQPSSAQVAMPADPISINLQHLSKQAAARQHLGNMGHWPAEAYNMPVGAASGGSPPRASTTTMPEIDDNLFEHLEAAVVHGGDDFDADWTSREQHYMALHGANLEAGAPLRMKMPSDPARLSPHPQSDNATHGHPHSAGAGSPQSAAAARGSGSQAMGMSPMDAMAGGGAGPRRTRSVAVPPPAGPHVPPHAANPAGGIDMMAGAHPNMANPGTPRTHTNNTNTNQLQPQGSMGGLNMAGGLAGAAVATPTMQGQGGSTPKRARLLTSFSLAAPGAAGMAAPQTAACAAGMSGQGGGAASGVMIGPNGAPLLSSQSLPTSLAPMGPGGFPLGIIGPRHMSHPEDDEKLERISALMEAELIKGNALPWDKFEKTDDIELVLNQPTPRRTAKRGGGRHGGADPHLDPDMDPKKAKRIVANRLSAARSKLKQKIAAERVEKERAELAEQRREVHTMMRSLQDEVFKLTTLNATLNDEIDLLNAHVANLEGENEAFKKALLSAGIHAVGGVHVQHGGVAHGLRGGGNAAHGGVGMVRGSAGGVQAVGNNSPAMGGSPRWAHNGHNQHGFNNGGNNHSAFAMHQQHVDIRGMSMAVKHEQHSHQNQQHGSSFAAHAAGMSPRAGMGAGGQQQFGQQHHMEISNPNKPQVLRLHGGPTGVPPPMAVDMAQHLMGGPRGSMGLGMHASHGGAGGAGMMHPHHHDHAAAMAAAAAHHNHHMHAGAVMHGGNMGVANDMHDMWAAEGGDMMMAGAAPGGALPGSTGTMTGGLTGEGGSNGQMGSLGDAFNGMGGGAAQHAQQGQQQAQQQAQQQQQQHSSSNSTSHNMQGVTSTFQAQGSVGQ